MRLFWLVVAGGTAGTLTRYGLRELIGTDTALPVATLLENVTGSFALGALLAWFVARRGGAEEGAGHRQARLLLGTGFLGGYTTYSALAMETDTLLRGDQVALGLAYALGSVVAGLLAALAGIASARALAGRAAR